MKSLLGGRAVATEPAEEERPESGHSSRPSSSSASINTDSSHEGLYSAAQLERHRERQQERFEKQLAAMPIQQKLYTKAVRVYKSLADPPKERTPTYDPDTKNELRDGLIVQPRDSVSSVFNATGSDRAATGAAALPPIRQEPAGPSTANSSLHRVSVSHGNTVSRPVTSVLSYASGTTAPTSGTGTPYLAHGRPPVSSFLPSRGPPPLHRPINSSHTRQSQELAKKAPAEGEPTRVNPHARSKFLESFEAAMAAGVQSNEFLRNPLRFRHAERAIRFWNTRLLGMAFRKWAYVFVDKAEKKARLSKAAHLFLNVNNRTMLGAWNKWLDYVNKLHFLRGIFLKAQNRHLHYAFEKWKQLVDELHETQDDKMRGILAFYNSVQKKSFNQWVGAVRAVKARRAEEAEQDRLHKVEDQAIAARSEVLWRVMGVKDGEVDQHKIKYKVNVGYLVNGPMRCKHSQKLIQTDDLCIVSVADGKIYGFHEFPNVEEVDMLILGNLREEDYDQVKALFRLTAFVSNMHRSDAVTADGRFLKIDYIDPKHAALPESWLHEEESFARTTHSAPSSAQGSVDGAFGVAAERATAQA